MSKSRLKTHEVGVTPKRRTPAAQSGQSGTAAVPARAALDQPQHVCGLPCVFCPVMDVLHLVHGLPTASMPFPHCTEMFAVDTHERAWYFSTAPRDADRLDGGLKVLAGALTELIDRYQPPAAFIYPTIPLTPVRDELCLLCAEISRRKRLPVIPVLTCWGQEPWQSAYHAVGEAMLALSSAGAAVEPHSANILGDMRPPHQARVVREYLEHMGIQVVANFAQGVGVDDLRSLPRAAVNIVLSDGLMTELAAMLQARVGTPWLPVSFFGARATAESLEAIGRFFHDTQIARQTQRLIQQELSAISRQMPAYTHVLKGRTAAIYTHELARMPAVVEMLHALGMEACIVRGMTGTLINTRDGIAPPDATEWLPAQQLFTYLQGAGVELLLGDPRERAMAAKLGIGFCDLTLLLQEMPAGFTGLLYLARKLAVTLASPVWALAAGRSW